MRRSEIAGMTWDQVDLKKRTVTLLETKNGEKRIVPLSTEAVRILVSLPRRIDGNVWEMASDSITQAFIRALARARKVYEKECEEKGAKLDPGYLVDLTFHDLRHEATTRFFEKGLNPMQVAAITGHKTLQMLKRYTHLKAEDLAELLE
jgi:integrase